MDLIFLAEFSELANVHLEASTSPEDFISSIEEALENGDLTLDEAIQYIADYNRSP